jgi:BA14K-like protein
MRILPVAVGVLGISLIGVSVAPAIPVDAAAVGAAAVAQSPVIKVVSGTQQFGRYPSCKHLRSYNPKTRTFIGRDGKQHPCVPHR